MYITIENGCIKFYLLQKEFFKIFNIEIVQNSLKLLNSK